MQKHYQQIDIIKGFAIVSVIILHSSREESLLNTFSIFHIWQAVPLFMVLMGLNAGMANARKRPELSRLYSADYFRRKFNRIIFPFLLTFGLSILLGLGWWWVTGQNRIDFRHSNLMGVLPVSGPGNYFITLTLQAIMLLPIIRYLFQRRPFLLLIGLVLAEVGFLLLSDNLQLFTRNNYLYSSAFPRYFSAIAFGLVLSKLVFRPARPTKIILITSSAFISCVYLLQLTYGHIDIPQIKPEWKAQNILTFSYAAFIVFILFKLLPDKSENWLSKILATLGKASYHIFLLQVVYFGLIGEQNHHLWQNLLICLPAGYFFCRYESAIQSFFFRTEEKN